MEPREVDMEVRKRRVRPDTEEACMPAPVPAEGRVGKDTFTLARRTDSAGGHGHDMKRICAMLSGLCFLIASRPLGPVLQPQSSEDAPPTPPF